MVKNYEDLFKIGAEASNIKYENFWDWFVYIGDINFHWEIQPTYILSQSSYILGSLLTLFHALKYGGRLPYLWLGIVLHGFVTEALSYFLPDVDNFWHSQTPIIFLGRRLPLHIILLYPVFLYNAAVAVAKMRLPKWAEPFAVGLATVLIDIPYDIVSVNFLHWTWHDTDPNIADRHYWVPWNSYYFHATFAASFTFWFHFTRKLICKNNEKWQSDSFTRELICTILSGILGVPGGILLFLPIYHPLHDNYKVHSEVTFFILFSLFLLITWLGMRKVIEEKTEKTGKSDWASLMLLFHLILHYTLFLAMTLFFNPEDEISIGLKEPIGPCDQYVDMRTAFGQVLKKRKYLCATDYDEKYFDWSCLPNGKPPSEGSIWYTACGVPLPNRVELIAIIGTIWVLGVTIFGSLHLSLNFNHLFKNTTNYNKKNKTFVKQKMN